MGIINFHCDTTKMLHTQAPFPPPPTPSYPEKWKNHLKYIYIYSSKSGVLVTQKYQK